jgi:glutamate carboxypeptidase
MVVFLEMRPRSSFVKGLRSRVADTLCPTRRYTVLKLFFVVPLLLFGAVLAWADSALLEAAQQKKEAFLRDLATIVNIDSGTDDAGGLARVESFLAGRLKELGADVEVLPAPPAAGRMVVGTFRGKGTADVMLLIHYDTVFGVGEAARRPFRIEGTRAFGPGVADAKGGALVILHAVAMALDRGSKGYRTLTVLFNPDEEKSSLGSRETIRRLSSQHDYVLIYEPPDGDRVTVATNGIAYVHLNVKGVASHAGSAPEKGRNAAVELAHQIMQLGSLGDAGQGTTVNWTVMRSGEKVNVIPDKAEATADMRMSVLAETRRVQRDAERITQKKLIPETEVTVRVEERRPPLPRNQASDRLAALAGSIYEEIGKKIQPVAMRYGTDAGFAYDPNGSGPAVIDGMGIVGDRIHSADEWADLESIAPRLYLTVRMLEMLGKKSP